MELTAAIAGLVLLIFVAGWASALIWRRMAEAAAPRSDRADEVVAELLIVEEERDKTIAEYQAREASLRKASLEADEKYATAMREKEADLDAAMSGLRSARRQVEELKAK